MAQHRLAPISRGIARERRISSNCVIHLGPYFVAPNKFGDLRVLTRVWVETPVGRTNSPSLPVGLPVLRRFALNVRAIAFTQMEPSGARALRCPNGGRLPRVADESAFASLTNRIVSKPSWIMNGRMQCKRT
jgi:hypothetical protein